MENVRWRLAAGFRARERWGREHFGKFEVFRREGLTDEEEKGTLQDRIAW
jgi:hypothetical protein